MPMAGVAFPQAHRRVRCLAYCPSVRPCPGLMLSRAAPIRWAATSLQLQLPNPTRRSSRSIRYWAGGLVRLKAVLRGQSGRTSSLLCSRRKSRWKCHRPRRRLTLSITPVWLRFNSGIDPTAPIPLKFHPGFPTQNANSVWTFNGTIPPKLVQGRYMEPILFRHHNRLPADVNANNGFGRHTISTHEHNGHHGAENDGFTGAFFFPNQFYDYHWPIVLAGILEINTN